MQGARRCSPLLLSRPECPGILSSIIEAGDKTAPLWTQTKPWFNAFCYWDNIPSIHTSSHCTVQLNNNMTPTHLTDIWLKLKTIESSSLNITLSDSTLRWVGQLKLALVCLLLLQLWVWVLLVVCWGQDTETAVHILGWQAALIWTVSLWIKVSAKCQKKTPLCTVCSKCQNSICTWQGARVTGPCLRCCFTVAVADESWLSSSRKEPTAKNALSFWQCFWCRNQNN